MKKVWQIISIIVIIALALSMTAFAEKSVVIGGDPSTQTSAGVKIDSVVETGEVFVGVSGIESDKNENKKETVNGAVYTFSSECGNVGETVSVKVNFKTTAPASLAAIGPVTYDANVLEFKGFEFDPSVISEIDETLSGFDNEKMALVALFKTEGLYDVCLGTLQFEILDETSNPKLPKDDETKAKTRKQDVIALKINASTAYAFGKSTVIDPDNSKVVPYLKNDRTLVPLRFVSETLGADVQWKDGWNYCYVVKGDKKIKITFNSADIEVNGQIVTYDAPVEVVQDRTMVPIRFISEQLGYDVKWNQANQLVIITPADNPWVVDGQTEADVLEGILVTFLFNGIF